MGEGGICPHQYAMGWGGGEEAELAMKNEIEEERNDEVRKTTKEGDRGWEKGEKKKRKSKRRRFVCRG